jgi:hypothetical protein
MGVQVVGVRVGQTMPLHFVWFQRSLPVKGAPRTVIELGHGDVYIMSHKATGNDWMKKIIPTLRHAAGAPSFLKIKSE